MLYASLAGVAARLLLAFSGLGRDVLAWRVEVATAANSPLELREGFALYRLGVSLTQALRAVHRRWPMAVRRGTRPRLGCAGRRGGADARPAQHRAGPAHGYASKPRGQAAIQPRPQAGRQSRRRRHRGRQRSLRTAQSRGVGVFAQPLHAHVRRRRHDLPSGGRGCGGGVVWRSDGSGGQPGPGAGAGGAGAGSGDTRGPALRRAAAAAGVPTGGRARGRGHTAAELCCAPASAAAAAGARALGTSGGLAPGLAGEVGQEADAAGDADTDRERQEAAWLSSLPTDEHLARRQAGVEEKGEGQVERRLGRPGLARLKLPNTPTTPITPGGREFPPPSAGGGGGAAAGGAAAGGGKRAKAEFDALTRWLRQPLLPWRHVGSAAAFPGLLVAAGGAGGCVPAARVSAGHWRRRRRCGTAAGGVCAGHSGAAVPAAACSGFRGGRGGGVARVAAGTSRAAGVPRRLQRRWRRRGRGWRRRVRRRRGAGRAVCTAGRCCWMTCLPMWGSGGTWPWRPLMTPSRTCACLPTPCCSRWLRRWRCGWAPGGRWRCSLCSCWRWGCSGRTPLLPTWVWRRRCCRCCRGSRAPRCNWVCCCLPGCCCWGCWARPCAPCGCSMRAPTATSCTPSHCCTARGRCCCWVRCWV
uniref:LRG5 n=1 Tax=Chlamydomonas reinhardtii TaxID=3055 RepID=Q96397_CHLRE|nr:LRG5 [Chlamydomonas reinhardtii]AAB39840.1 LRG5 [Chlamydomonas reinhardtii]